jgi:hypothetical protein
VADDHHFATWPVLIALYYRLARREERESEAAFGDAYREYRHRVPMFLPRLGPRAGSTSRAGPSDEAGPRDPHGARDGGGRVRDPFGIPGAVSVSPEEALGQGRTWDRGPLVAVLHLM